MPDAIPGDYGKLRAETNPPLRLGGVYDGGAGNRGGGLRLLMRLPLRRCHRASVVTPGIFLSSRGDPRIGPRWPVWGDFPESSRPARHSGGLRYSVHMRLIRAQEVSSAGATIDLRVLANGEDPLRLS